MVYMMQLIDIFHDKHLNNHDIEVLVFLLKNNDIFFWNKIWIKFKPFNDFFESINSSQASQICGVENCIDSYVCEPYIDDVRDDEIDDESDRCGWR
jgi:hypothetical protein